MRTARLLVLVFLLPFPASASEEADDWKLIGSALALVQQIVHLAAQSDDPKAAQKGVDAMLQGQNAEANRLASDLFNEILLELPQEHRDAFISIGRDLLTLARREQARAAAQAPIASADSVLRARKELHAMGLRYWDEQKFLEAARCGDKIAVELYLAAQGLESKDSARNLRPTR